MKNLKNTYKMTLGNQFTSEDIIFENEEVNKIHCDGLSKDEFIEKHKDVKMEKITIKPLKKLWFEIVDKLRYSKPKSRINTFTYLTNELKEIYGKETGNMLMNIFCDIFETEFYKVNNGNFETMVYIINDGSEKKWVKVVNKVNSLMKTDWEIHLG